MTIQTLSYDDVLNIHNVLVNDFASTPDPIYPSGTRDDGGLLQSAVSRQHVGLGNK